MLMKHLSVVVVVSAIISSTASRAEEGSTDTKLTEDKQKSSATISVPQQTEAVWTSIGKGYVPYSYPAFGSCPCGDNSCYDPARYYHGGKPYRKQWFSKWVRAHLGKGSMLDDVPCGCRAPDSTRPYYRVTRPVKSMPEGVPTSSQSE